MLRHHPRHKLTIDIWQPTSHSQNAGFAGDEWSLVLANDDLETRVAKLESGLFSLALQNLELALCLEIVLRERNLDNPITIGSREPERPTSILDRVWQKVYKVLDNVG